MQAASRESYKIAAERLDAYVRGAEPSAVATTAADLLSVADLLRREPRLRRALSDPARSGADRSALLGELLRGKVGAEALDLVASLVAGRWSAPSELLGGTERLGVEALLASADSAGDLGEVEDELFRFGQVVSGEPALSNALADPIAPIGQRAGLVRELLAGKARPVTVSLVEVALSGFGGRSFTGALTRLVELAADRRDRQVAYVTAAAPLSEEDERRLGASLSAIYGREVSVKQTVDPSVLGGVSVRVGSDLYDGTVLRRLNESRNALTKR
ncbi:F0F1 ATP synthase subunit delta [Micromonospora peucetia]|uniref:ATP synthase subunit delta n=1 Tax=Micromonospora peucetia TaxID=47871 RepID=A0A1C6VFZ0_9ACTN|nr:F0F1 ATP synthase subunit delta [Micromonospora peucetia]MCX4389790.1 F0F1 ATP synthase subunit delta [Micromonospora peucetia]WSA30255.1 F0F1 ATP synthase subunit delta [Micromonospora peucetia]SCL65253.1 ATP synthase F1 subcomplex delta subunit [Micromonospora peucetia]